MNALYCVQGSYCLSSRAGGYQGDEPVITRLIEWMGDCWPVNYHRNTERWRHGKPETDGARSHQRKAPS